MKVLEARAIATALHAAAAAADAAHETDIDLETVLQCQDDDARQAVQELLDKSKAQ